MKAQFGQNVVDVWKVTLDIAPENWVQTLIDKKQLVWKKDANGPLLRIPAIEEIDKGKVLGDFAALRLGAIGDIRLRIGDYLVKENDGTLKNVSKKRFFKEFHTLE